MTEPESDEFYLSYSGRKWYVICPKMYEFRYILGDISRSDPKSSLFGTAIGKVFEWFYERHLWLEPDPLAAALALTDESIEFAITDKCWDRTSDLSYESVLRSELHEFIPAGFEAIRSHRLLTTDSRAEVNLKILLRSPEFDFPIILGGRADFIHRDGNETWIIDGKGSRHREKFVDSEQLIWYATQYFIRYHKVPSRLGFLYYRFPRDPIQWISYDANAIRNSVHLTFVIADRIKRQVFQATPSGHCHGCDHLRQCDEGQQYTLDHKVASDNRVGNSVFKFETI
jgi:hypothetical protein